MSLRVASYVLGGISLLLVITTILLIVFVRDHDSVSVSRVVSSAISAAKGPEPPSHAAKLTLTGGLTSPQDGLTMSLVGVNLKTPKVCRLSLPSYTIPGKDDADTVVKCVDPYLRDFTDEKSTIKPLTRLPNGYGWVAMTPTGDQMWTSTDARYKAFLQYNGQADSREYVVYESTPSASLLESNGAGYTLDDSDCQTSIEPHWATFKAGRHDGILVRAYDYGSVGLDSLVPSVDGIRMYAGYLKPFQGSDQGEGFNQCGEVSEDSHFPYRQMVGQVGVYRRSPTSSGNTIDMTESSNKDWTYDYSHTLSNPFGSQAAGIFPSTDPITGAALEGDRFGETIRASYNVSRNLRTVSVRSRYSAFRSDGAVVFVMEEQGDGSHIVEATLITPPEAQATDEGKRLFGQSFDVTNDRCLVTCAKGPDMAWNVAYFERDEESRVWSFKNFLAVPVHGEEFGRSVHINPTGDIAIIGAPTTTGGHVYMYEYKASDHTWVKRPSVLSPDEGNTRSFGYHVKVERDFRVVTVSVNQDSNVDQKLVGVQHTEVIGYVNLYGIDQSAVAFISDADSVRRLDQFAVVKKTGSKTFDDPLFGASVGMATRSRTVNRVSSEYLNVFMGEPCNGVVGMWSLKLD